MRRPESRTALHDVIARFQAEVQRLALAAARTVVEQELARRRTGLAPARPRKGRPAPPATRQLELGFGQAPRRQLELSLAPQAAPAAPAAPHVGAPAEPRRDGEPTRAPAAAVAPPAAATPEPPAALPAGGRGRARWTRDTIISELATWMLSGTVIDAQFMTRHGPKGLVAAIRRVFGRFDAALNLAALHNSKLYPEGPPARGASAGRPAAFAVAAPPEPK